MVAETGNWGRWGAEDEVGALNLLTPEVVLQAVGCVREGRTLSLSLPIRDSTSSHAPLTVPHLRGRPLPQHFMSVDGGDYAVGARRLKDEICLADDALVMSPHGTTTHLDALSHVWRDDQIYNGHPSGRIRSYGATRCGIDKAAAGFVGRGVLLDVAGHLGVPFLDESVRIDGDLLEACATGADVEMRRGDIAVVRTGWPTVFADQPERYQAGQPGLSYDGGRWLAERDVCMVASDNTGVGAIAADGMFDATPEQDLHLLFLWRHGIYLAEMLWLEELAVTGRHEFLFLAAPLVVDGGTGSAINPLAIL